ncbi:MAG: alpha/beta fold hydrolase [Clostridia bacterium]|nr:alpha/beta fold hydrolase [Clostridia bacterium]
MDTVWKKGPVTTRPLTFECRGNRLRGCVFAPADAPVPNRTVILSHGFASDMRTTRKYTPIFTELGWTTVIFDFPGSGCGTSAGDSTKMSCVTEKEDLLQLLEYLRDQPWVDPDRILLSGCSMGGFVSALAAGEQPEAVAGLVLFYPGFSIPHSARMGYLPDCKVDPERIPDTFPCGNLTLGRVFMEDAMQLDPWREIRRYQGPVFLIHGVEDLAVDVEFSRIAAEEYEDAVLVEIHGDHGFFRSGFPEAKAATQEWLRRWEDPKNL